MVSDNQMQGDCQHKAVLMIGDGWMINTDKRGRRTDGITLCRDYRAGWL